MTCCGANIVGGLLVLLVVAIAALLAVIALVLLVVGLVRRARGRSAKGVLLFAAAFGGLALFIPVSLSIVGRIKGDPRVLGLDLRGERSVKVLDTEEFPGFRDVYQLNSPRIDLELPDGRSLQTSVANTVFYSDGDLIEELAIRGPAEDSRVAAARVRSWGLQLDAASDAFAFDPAPSSEDRSEFTRTPGMVIELSTQSLVPFTGDDRAIARTRIEFTDAGEP